MELKECFSNKRGSFAILAVMIFASMVILTFALIRASGQAAVDSAVKSFGVLWGKSILGEYDLYLKERYGIFGFYGNEYAVEEKITEYADYSFGEKDYISLDKVACSLDQHSLTLTENLERQIYHVVVYNIPPPQRQGEESYGESYGEGYGESYRGSYGGRYGEREIEASWILGGLPSYGKTEKWYLTGIVKKIKEGVTAGGLVEQLAVDKYISKFFKEYNNHKDLPNTFFSCEIEYIIGGENSDERNKKDVSSKIKTLRNMLNLYYLYTCSEKREAALLLAEVITPGPAAVLTQAVILETWAYSEAVNDINILYDGKTVPLLKNDSNWALSLENVFNSDGTPREDAGENKKRYILPQSLSGEEYGTYLRILLAGMPRETKLLRIMDLIQVNGKYTYVDSFLMAEYYGGLDYEMEVNGKIYTFRESY